MQIEIGGKQIDIGESLQTHVNERLTAGILKYFDNPVDAMVHFAREGSDFKCDTSVHLSSGISLQATGQAGEIYSAFEEALEHLEKRLRRYKRRLKSHHANNKEPLPAMAAPSYVIASGADHDEEPEDLQPAIVAEDVTQVKTLTVGEAVMQMELTDTPALLFKNRANEAMNVVYRRADGNIGWIDPQNN